MKMLNINYHNKFMRKIDFPSPARRLISENVSVQRERGEEKSYCYHSTFINHSLYLLVRER
jgi:hypothetical protein